MSIFTQRLKGIAKSCLVSLLLVMPLGQLAIGMLPWSKVGVNPSTENQGIPDGPMSFSDPAHIAEAKLVYSISLVVTIICSLFSIGFYVVDAWNYLRRAEYIHLTANTLQFLSIFVMVQSWTSINQVGKIGAILVAVEGSCHAYWITTFPVTNPEVPTPAYETTEVEAITSVGSVSAETSVEIV